MPYRMLLMPQDRITRSFSEYLRGEYLLSNDAGFNPNVGDTTEWRRMDRRDGRGQ